MKKNTALKKETNYAIDLFKKLFSIKLVKIISITLVVLIVFFIAMFLIFKPTVQKNINYGVNFSSKYATELGMDWKQTYLKIINELGLKNMRIVAYWDEVEPENNKYKFEDVKWQLEEARKRNIGIIMAIGYKVPRYPECFAPEWVAKYTDEEKRKELIDYIKRSVEEYKGYENIKIWQIENEPFWPFGHCRPIERETIAKEIAVVRAIDNRPILIQDSGEGGIWYPTYSLADKLGISMYRKIWYDFWGIFFGNFIYFQYPLAHWTYKIKADIVGVPYENILVTELQAEPWGPGTNSKLTQEDIDQTMSHHHFLDNLTYAQKGGFKDLYFWGAEWWLYMKEYRNDSYYWDTAKALLQNNN